MQLVGLTGVVPGERSFSSTGPGPGNGYRGQTREKRAGAKPHISKLHPTASPRMTCSSVYPSPRGNQVSPVTGPPLGPAGGIPLTGTALLTNDPGSVTVNLNIYRARLRAGSRDLALNY